MGIDHPSTAGILVVGPSERIDQVFTQMVLDNFFGLVLIITRPNLFPKDRLC